MILENLTRALKSQNWVAVAIEFVIVILGVVIGFQVNAWNEDRIKRATEAAVLARFNVEFSELVELEAAYLARAAEQNRLMTAWIEAAEDPLDLDADRLRGLAVDFYELENPQRASVMRDAPIQDVFTDPIGGERHPEASLVFEELMASGDFKVVRSNALRTALIRREAQRSQSLAGIARNDTSGHISPAKSLFDAAFIAGSTRPSAPLDAALDQRNFAKALRTYQGLKKFNDRFYRLVHEETLAVLELLESADS